MEDFIKNLDKEKDINNIKNMIRQKVIINFIKN
jgi:hypothetical protein